MKTESKISILKALYLSTPFLYVIPAVLITGIKDPIFAFFVPLCAWLIQLLPYYCLQHKVLYGTFAVKKSWNLIWNLRDTIP